MTEVVAQIVAQRVVPVIRAPDADAAAECARACARGGMRVIELTETVPGVESAVASLAREGLTIGVGTVVDADRVAVHVAAGARFVVSYAHPAGFVAAATAHGVPAVPGAFTPGEVLAAASAGAAMVKVFPAGSVSPDHVRALRAVGLTVPLMVTGGIAARADAVRPWLDAGASAVGLGGDLVRGDGVQERARRLLDALGPQPPSA